MRILVTGASVAGCCVAWWLGRYGFDVEVVEKAPEFRGGGQNVDVRGVGREVLRSMALEEEAMARHTGEEGTVWVDGDGRRVAAFLTDEATGDGPTAELEILRGELAGLLYNAAATRAAFRFGDTVRRIEDEAGGARVSFASGGERTFDAVIVAEGVGSPTRELVLPGENDPRWMDLTIAYFTIPRAPNDDRTWRWYNAPGGRSVSIRPDNTGTARAMLSIQRSAAGEQDWDVARQKAWLQDTFADAGWQTPRVLAGLERTEDFYFDALRQVRLPRWASGRTVLVGDAAWCATPLAGIGTTLAVTGARVLAGELALNRQNVPAALAAYEGAMRPMVEEGQGVPKIGPRLMNPHSRLGIRLLHGALGLASLPAIRGTAAKLFAREPKRPDLSRYPAPA